MILKNEECGGLGECFKFVALTVKVSSKDSMKKIVIHKAGGYSQLQFESAPDLFAHDDEVVVEVKATGVNYADVIIRWGFYESAKQMVGWPITPGFEFSGLVKSVGKNIKNFKVGDKVFGVTLFDGYASEVKVPGHQLYALPDFLSFEQAAGIPAVYMTAYHALFQNVVVRPGMMALIHSAAGGVGSALVQMCRIAGIKTIGVVGSSHKVNAVKELGANFVIDKSTENLWKKVEEYAPGGVDLCFDANGIETLKQSYEHLAPCGKLMAYGAHSLFPKSGGKINYLKLIRDYLRSPRFNPLEMTSENKSLITFNLSFLFGREDLFTEGMTAIMKWLAEGKLKAPKVTTYSLEKVADAHRDLESGKTIGKLILLP
jgi:NADPH:quinone reductase-like Zn-dependent oxidoreductase